MAFSGKAKGKGKGKNDDLIDTKNFFDGSVFTYENDTHTIRFKSSGFRSVYGALEVSVPSKELKCVEWTLKIVATQPTTNIMLGICSTPNQFQGSYQTTCFIISHVLFFFFFLMLFHYFFIFIFVKTKNKKQKKRWILPLWQWGTEISLKPM